MRSLYVNKSRAIFFTGSYKFQQCHFTIVIVGSVIRNYALYSSYSNLRASSLVIPISRPWKIANCSFFLWGCGKLCKYFFGKYLLLPVHHLIAFPFPVLKLFLPLIAINPLQIHFSTLEQAEKVPEISLFFSVYGYKLKGIPTKVIFFFIRWRYKFNALQKQWIAFMSLNTLSQSQTAAAVPSKRVRVRNVCVAVLVKVEMCILR